MSPIYDTSGYPHEDPELEALIADVGRRIAVSIKEAGEGRGRKLGFALLVFDFGAGGFLTWMSNANREDMIRVLREFTEKLQSHTQ